MFRPRLFAPTGCLGRVISKPAPPDVHCVFSEQSFLPQQKKSESVKLTPYS